MWGHVYTALSFGQQLYLVITLLACMAVRRGAGSGAELQEGDFIDDTSDLPDYDEVVSNWTEFAQGASPRFLQEPEPWSQLRNPVFHVVLDVEALQELEPPVAVVEKFEKACLCKGQVDSSDFAHTVELLGRCNSMS